MMRLGLLFSLCMLCAIGCNRQEYSQCEPPHDHLEIMFKDRSDVNPFSHAFCIVCNPGLEVDEYIDWASAMGAEALNVDPNDVHPCLYVYDPTRSEAGITDLAMCTSLVCDDRANYNDLVSKENGNFDLSPILD